MQTPQKRYSFTRLTRLPWSVFMCLAFTRDWEWNFRKYCDSTRQPSHRTLMQSTAEIPSLELVKLGTYR